MRLHLGLGQLLQGFPCLGAEKRESQEEEEGPPSFLSTKWTLYLPCHWPDLSQVTMSSRKEVWEMSPCWEAMCPAETQEGKSKQSYLAETGQKAQRALAMILCVSPSISRSTNAGQAVSTVVLRQPWRLTFMRAHRMQSWLNIPASPGGVRKLIFPSCDLSKSQG